MEGEETKEEGDWKLSANQGRVKSTGGGAVDRGKTPRRVGWVISINHYDKYLLRRVLGLTMKNPGWGRLERPEKTPDRTKQTTNGCIG